MYPHPLRHPLWPALVACFLAFAIVGTAVAEIRTGPVSTENSAGKPVAPTTFAPVVKRVMPSIVNIFSSRKVTTAYPDGERFTGDPLLRRFFDDQFGGWQIPPRERQERSLGSGVIITPDGYIVTNNHVVDGGTDIKVSLSDKREYTARIVGTDKKTDLAVLKIDQTGLPALTMAADSSKIEVGDIVLALGNPFGVAFQHSGIRSLEFT